MVAAVTPSDRSVVSSSSPSTPVSRAERSRLNARRSTGPKTAEGKERSSRNALRHGFYSVRVYMNEPERVAWEAFRDAYVRSLAPRDAVEAHQAQQIASIQWRLNRFEETEAELLARRANYIVQTHLGSAEKLEKELAQARLNDDDLQRALRRKGPTEKAEAAFWSSRLKNGDGLTRPEQRDEAIRLRQTYRDTADISPARTTAESISSSDVLDDIGKLQQRLEGQLQRAWKQYRLLQDPDRPIVVFDIDDVVETNPEERVQGETVSRFQGDDGTKPAEVQEEVSPAPSEVPSTDEPAEMRNEATENTDSNAECGVMGDECGERSQENGSEDVDPSTAVESSDELTDRTGRKPGRSTR